MTSRYQYSMVRWRGLVLWRMMTTFLFCLAVMEKQDAASGSSPEAVSVSATAGLGDAAGLVTPAGREPAAALLGVAARRDDRRAALAGGAGRPGKSR